MEEYDCMVVVIEPHPSPDQLIPIGPEASPAHNFRTSRLDVTGQKHIGYLSQHACGYAKSWPDMTHAM